MYKDMNVTELLRMPEGHPLRVVEYEQAESWRIDSTHPEFVGTVALKKLIDLPGEPLHEASVDVAA